MGQVRHLMSQGWRLREYQGSASGHTESYVCTCGSQIMLSIVGRVHCTEQMQTQCGLFCSDGCVGPRDPFSDLR